MFLSPLLLMILSDPSPGGLPKPEHGLQFNTPVAVWDEALPLGNGILGALVWGDGQPLRISLDRTDLWDLRPVPEFHSEDYSYAKMREWEKAGRYDDLLRMYDKPYERPAPTKIPAGRIELTLEGKPAFQACALTLADATADVAFEGDVHVRVWVHAEEPVGIIEIDRAVPVTPKLIVPAFGGKEAGPAQPSIVAGELANLGYPPPVIHRTDNSMDYEQEGWGGF